MNNILYIGGFELPDKNAAAQRVIAIGKTLREMGYNVTYVGVSKDGNDGRALFDGFECHSLPYPQNTKEWLRHICEYIPLTKLAEYNPDSVILYNFPAIASLKILHYCHNHGIKVFHDTTEWEYANGHSLRDIINDADTWLRMHYCLKKMNGVIAISRFLYNYYMVKVKTILVPPTVDLADKKWDMNRELTANNIIKLVYAGSAGAKCKDRLDRIIDAVYCYNNIALKVVGLTQEQYEKDFGRFPNDCKNVEFIGRLPHTDAVEAVRDADFQMLIREDSLKNKAGFPTKFVESISCCTPLIATLSSNIGDYLIDGKNGFVVDEQNTLDKVFKRVSSLSAEKRVEMKRYCRNNNPFDYHNYIDEFNKMFTE